MLNVPVRTVCGAKGVVDVDIAQLCQRRAEGRNVGLLGLDLPVRSGRGIGFAVCQSLLESTNVGESRPPYLVPVLVLGFALLLNVEAEVLQQKDRAYVSQMYENGKCTINNQLTLAERNRRCMCEPSAGLLVACSTSGPTQSFRKLTLRPNSFSTTGAMGSNEYLGLTLPSGRPRWLISTTERAPNSTPPKEGVGLEALATKPMGKPQH